MRYYYQKKEKNYIEKVVPWISIIVSIIGFFILYILNQNTNKTLKEINDKSIEKEIELKRYEVNIKDKREALSNLLISINTFHTEHAKFCWMSDIIPPYKYPKYLLDSLDRHRKIVENCLQDLDEKTIKLSTYLNDEERDSLKIITTRLKDAADKYLRLQTHFQGWNIAVAFDYYEFQKYIRYINKLMRKVYLESILDLK